MTPISVRFSRPELAPPLEILRGLNDTVGDYVLVGAYARNVRCLGLGGLDYQVRNTHDVDITIAVPWSEDLSSVMSGLTQSRSSAITFTLPGVPGVPIDAIPYGPGVNDVTDVRIDRDRSLDATGMAEAARCSIPVTIHVRDAAPVTVAVPPLHAQVALKLIAYQLRVELPDFKDAGDLAVLLDATSMGALAEQDCFDHSHLFPQLDYDHDLVGPYLAGVRIHRDFGAHLAQRVVSAVEDARLPGLMRRHRLHRPHDETPLEDRLDALTQGLADKGSAADPEIS